MKTFDYAQKDRTEIWIKKMQGPDENGPYSLQQFELNCGARQIRRVSSEDYDASNQPVQSFGAGKWDSVFPETLGEYLYTGACTH
jgi:hypothetical protein